MTRRMSIYSAALLILAFTWTGWSLLQLLDTRAAAQVAAGDLADCLRWEGEITRLRTQPATATDRTLQKTELAAPIEKAAHEAGIPSGRLMLINPEQAQRLDETDYKKIPWRVDLKNVTLKQVAQMVHAITTGPAGLDLESIRLTAPSRDATEGTWSAELVFVYLVYEPYETKL